MSASEQTPPPSPPQESGRTSRQDEPPGGTHDGEIQVGAVPIVHRLSTPCGSRREPSLPCPSPPCSARLRRLPVILRKDLRRPCSVTLPRAEHSASPHVKVEADGADDAADSRTGVDANANSNVDVLLLFRGLHLPHGRTAGLYCRHSALLRERTSTSDSIESAIAATRCAACVAVVASPKAPQHTMYASPMVLTLCTCGKARA